MKRFAIPFLAALIVLLLGLALWGTRGGSSDATVGASPTDAPRGDESDFRGSALTLVAPLPESLRGTRVDGDFRVDADGRLVPGPEALRLFDYFLSAVGEEPRSVARRRIEAEINARLPESARADARRLLDRYFEYRSAAGDLTAAGLAEDDLERRLQRVRELRRDVFGADTARALFGEEEAFELLALERRRVNEDPSLTEEEREARREAIDARLPEPIRQARAEARLPGALSPEEALLREAGADAGRIRALRESMVGVEAADRLEALDQSRARWEARLTAYRSERDALLGEDPDADVEALRGEHFDPHELARVRALDRIQ